MNIHSAYTVLTIACFATSGAAGSEPLGRLFFSPAERVQIDRVQRPAPPSVPPPRLDGFITRSDGPPVLFLDGKAHAASPRQIHPQDASVSLTTADGRSHRLQVGNPSSGTAP